MLIAAAKEFQHEHGLPEDGHIFSVNENPLSYDPIKKDTKNTAR